MNISKNDLYKAIKFIVILSLLPAIVYYFKFQSLTVSDKPADWGPFGDFVGGIVNPLLALINIIVLLYITFILSEIEENRNNRGISNQKAMLITELRSNLYNSIINELTKISLTSIVSKNVIIELINTRQYFMHTSKTSDHLFPGFSTSNKVPLINTSLDDIRRGMSEYKKLRKELIQSESAIAGGNNPPRPLDDIRKEMRAKMESLNKLTSMYSKYVREFSKEMQEIMMNGIAI